MFGAVSCYASGNNFASLTDIFSELLDIFVVDMLLFFDAVIAEFRSAS